MHSPGTFSAPSRIAAAAAAFACAACGAGPTSPLAAPAPSPPPSAVASTAPIALPPAVHHPAAELDPALAVAHAPDVFQALFSTTKGEFVIEVHRAWAPNGADRFYNLVKLGFYDDTRFFRAIPRFMVQFGIPADPRVAEKWLEATIPDDPVVQSNIRGFVSFAQTSLPNSRTTQVFVDCVDNTRLDASRFAPFGRVAQGMDVVTSLYNEYGEGAPEGNGPDQSRIQRDGNAYLDGAYPKLDHILFAKIVGP